MKVAYVLLALALVLLAAGGIQAQQQLGRQYETLAEYFDVLQQQNAVIAELQEQVRELGQITIEVLPVEATEKPREW